MRQIVFLSLFASFAASAHAQSLPALSDKSGYTLFNPTPRELRRPMSGDRPDTTESPYTVDAGAVQLEMSFIDYARNGSTDAWAFAAFNLKIGLLNNVDLQLVFNPHLIEDDGDDRRDGFGETEIRLKINLWGNDEGRTAFAFMPYIKFPTASNELGNDHVEGGLIVPFAVELAEGVDLGLMFQADFVHDDADDGYDTEFIATAVIGFELTERIGVYVEGVGIISTDGDTPFRGILGFGVTYAASSDLVFDAGINLGLTSDADDVNLFTGMTIRF